MSESRDGRRQTFVVVTAEQAGKKPYPYVHVNADGTVRELRPEERAFLERPFTFGDGGRPAVKASYESLNGWGNQRGYCRRSAIPKSIVIQPVPKAPSDQED